MLEWISENQELLIAVFGAGGAGAFLLARIFGSRKSDKAAPPSPAISATASDSGVAVAHAGRGDVSVKLNDAIDETTLRAVQDRLSLSLAETARLLQACNHAGFSPEDIDTLIARLDSETGNAAALAQAVRDGADDRIAALLRELGGRATPSAPGTA